MPAGDFAEMTRQLALAEVAAEPRNGVDSQALGRLAASVGCSRMETVTAGRWTHATPPYADREFSSPAWIHTLTWT